MLEFEDLAYLDVQKTGSTFVSHFLRTFARSDVVRYEQHKPVEGRAPGKVYVISCRDPLAQYVSLYSFGCMNRGAFRGRLIRSGQGHLYRGTTEGLNEWLDVVLHPSVRSYLSGYDDNAVLDSIGVLSMRFLRLALPDHLSAFAAIKKHRDAVRRLRGEGLCDVILRTETLNADLAALVTGEHRTLFKDHPEALRYLDTAPKENTTEGVFGIDPTALPARTLRLVQQRERLFFTALGYPWYVEGPN
jgi:hypothetical protein